MRNKPNYAVRDQIGALPLKTGQTYYGRIVNNNLHTSKGLIRVFDQTSAKQVWKQFKDYYTKNNREKVEKKQDTCNSTICYTLNEDNPAQVPYFPVGVIVKFVATLKQNSIVAVQILPIRLTKVTIKKLITKSNKRNFRNPYAFLALSEHTLENDPELRALVMKLLGRRDVYCNDDCFAKDLNSKPSLASLEINQEISTGLMLVRQGYRAWNATIH